jgi:nickel superoxide dismutase
VLRALFTALFVCTGFVAEGFAHCQVPCGIYDDAARITQMLEDTETIRKAMNQMAELQGKSDPQSMNQMTRWILTKEEHASRIITTVSEYFLTQKLKPVPSSDAGHEAYLQKLADHHAVMRAAMKAKQSTDPSLAGALHDAIDAMAVHYGQKK